MGGFIRQGFGPRGEKIGSREPLAIVEMVCEQRSCGVGVAGKGGHLFAKLGQLLGTWRIIRAARPEFIGPRVVAEMCVAKKSLRSLTFRCASAQDQRDAVMGKRPRFQRSRVPMGTKSCQRSYFGLATVVIIYISTL